MPRAAPPADTAAPVATSVAPARSRRGPRAAAPALIAVVLLGVGCVPAPERPAKVSGSALWIGRPARQLSVADLDRLRDVGIRELYVELASLAPGAADPLDRDSLPELPPSTPVTVVVTGAQVPGEGRVTDLVTSLHQIRFDLEAAGLIPVGVHFDLAVLEPTAESVELFAALRSQLDPELYLSFSLHRDVLGRPRLERLVRTVDFVVPFLYGQRPSEADDTGAWTLDDLGQQLDRVDELEVPYALGVIGLGTIRHERQGGTVEAKTTTQAFYPFLRDRALELDADFVLQGANRRSYSLAVKRATTIAGWSLAAGDQIHVVRPATHDFKDLLQRVAATPRAAQLGQVFYRLPAPEESLSLGMDHLLNAFADSPPAPELTLEVQVLRRTLRGRLLRIAVLNHNGEITELSFIDNNYLQITGEPAIFAENVETGDFYRYDLMRAGRDGSLERTFRSPNVLRLYLPMVDGRQRVTSGEIELVGARPRLRLEGRFLLPDGRSLEVGPFFWENGEMVDAAGEPVPGA